MKRLRDRQLLARARPASIAVVCCGLLTATLAMVYPCGSAIARRYAGSIARIERAPEDCTVAAATSGRQIRAMWIVSAYNLDWPSKPGLSQAAVMAEYTAWMRLAKQKNLNAVIVQVRDSGGVLWPSRFEPWSQSLVGVRGTNPGWDPMQFIVDETHRFGLEFHAWFNPYHASVAAPMGAGTRLNGLPAGHPLRQHPDWAVAYPSGRSGRLYYDPGNPSARRFVGQVIDEAVERYDLDGVHFDDHFYPSPEGDEPFPDDASYRRYGAGQLDRETWRRNNVDALIQEVSQRTHASKPWVRVGVSPMGIWRNSSSDPLGSATAGGESYSLVYGDSRKWVTEGWLDYVVPQLYWSVGFAVADYATLVSWWSDLVSGTRVQLYVGQAAYKAGSTRSWDEPKRAWDNPAELSDHLNINNRYPAIAGDVFFRAEYVRADRLGAISRVVGEHYRRPALPPLLRNVQAGRLPAPAGVVAMPDPSSGAAIVTWQQVPAPETAANRLRVYAVYRFEGDTPPRCDSADLIDPIATVTDTRFVDSTVRPGMRYTYRVTSVDRLWRESPAGAARLG